MDTQQLLWVEPCCSPWGSETVSGYLGEVNHVVGQILPCLCRAESHKDWAVCRHKDCTSQESYCKFEMLIRVRAQSHFCCANFHMTCLCCMKEWLVSIAVTWRKPNICNKVNNVCSLSQHEPFIKYSSWGSSLITQNSIVINISTGTFLVF